MAVVNLHTFSPMLRGTINPSPLTWLDLLERWPTLEQLQRAHPGTLRKFFQQSNCRSQETNAERIAAIQQAISATQDQAVREACALIKASGSQGIRFC